VPALITRLKAERTDRPLRTPPSSAIALGRIGAPSVVALTELLQRTNGLVRLNAVIALGYIGADAKPAVADLIPLLKNTEPALRQAVALSLGNIAPMTAELKPVLIDLVREDDILTSSSALALLEKIDPEGAREFEPK
jgi:HEAT repeat protein